MLTWWLRLPKKKDKSDSCTNLLFAKSLPDPASCDKWSVQVVICGLGWNCDATYVRLQDIGLWITNRTRLCFALSGRGDKSVGNVKLCKSRNMWQLRWRWAACEWVGQLWRRDPRERLPDLTSDWMMAEGLARNKVINIKKIMISMEMMILAMMLTIITILMMTMMVMLINIKGAIQFTLFNLSQEWKGSINDIRMCPLPPPMLITF